MYFRQLCSCDLALDPVTFVYEPDPYPWRYTGCAKMNFLRNDFEKLSYHSLRMHTSQAAR